MNVAFRKGHFLVVSQRVPGKNLNSEPRIFWRSKSKGLILYTSEISVVFSFVSEEHVTMIPHKITIRIKNGISDAE